MRSFARVLGSMFVALVAVTALSQAASVSPDDPKPVTVTGYLHVYQEDDFERGETRRVRVLEPSDGGKPYTLTFQGFEASDPPSGSLVTVRGLPRGAGEIVLTSRTGSIQVLVETAETSVGQRRAVVLLVDFTDTTVSCTNSAVAALMFTGTQSVDGLYRETSFGAISFPGDTDGNGQPDVFRVNAGTPVGSTCDYSRWATAADAAAQSAGVNLGLYQHKVYVLPSTAPCSWAGLASLGCATSCRAWIKTCSTADVYAHELGHNLGMHHAATDTNNDGVIDCEYCDRSDIMGYGGVGWRQVNGPHKVEMGWLPVGQVVDVPPIGTQTFVLTPLETDPRFATFPQVLKITRPNQTTHYYLSYRVRTGYDSTLNSLYASKISVHTWSGRASDKTRYVVALQNGQSFTDASIGFEVVQLASDAQSVTLQLTLGPNCAECGPCAGDPAGDADGDGVCGSVDNCPQHANPNQSDLDADGTGDVCDGCPSDPGKQQPGVCGCGVADTDSDGDGVPNCNDACPSDPQKVNPGVCGCGVADTDSDGDGVPNCNDACPADARKVSPGACGCGVADIDSDGDGTMDCRDTCPGMYNPSQRPADCGPLRVNFSPPSSSVPAGWLRDDGSVFDAARGHGWSARLPSRQRGSSMSLEYDTFVFTNLPQHWQIEWPNGDYAVRIVSGDVSFPQGPHRVGSREQVLINDVATSAGAFVDGTARVQIRNGRLELSAGGTSGNTMVNWIEVIPVPASVGAVRSFNFQPGGAQVPVGYRPDSGEPFSLTRGFGWNGSLASRDRNRNVPQTNDTFVFSNARRVWELVLDPGRYDVLVSVGDADFAQGPHRVAVEGVAALDRERTAAGEFLERRVQVDVHDGRLTLEIGGGGGNTTLCQIVVAPVSTAQE